MTTMKQFGRIKLAFEVLNPGTKKAQDKLRRYRCSDERDITQAYKSPSRTKVQAFSDIKEECALAGGTDIRIAGHNMYLFSVGYRAVDSEGQAWLIFHTPFSREGIRL